MRREISYLNRVYQTFCISFSVTFAVQKRWEMLCFMLALWVGSWITGCGENALPELMFLLPLTQKERRRYVRIGYVVRLAFGMLPVAAVCAGLALTGRMSGMRVIYLVWIGLLFLAEGNLGTYEAECDSYSKNTYKKQTYYKVWLWWCTFVNIFVIIFENGCESYQTPLIVFEVILLVISTVSAIGILVFWNLIMKKALDFEGLEKAESRGKGKRRWKTYAA